jgi:hypothetical protein
MKSILASIVASIILFGVVTYIQRAAACDGTPNCTFETTVTIPQGNPCGGSDC